MTLTLLLADMNSDVFKPEIHLQGLPAWQVFEGPLYWAIWMQLKERYPKTSKVYLERESRSICLQPTEMYRNLC